MLQAHVFLCVYVTTVHSELQARNQQNWSNSVIDGAFKSIEQSFKNSMCINLWTDDFMDTLVRKSMENFPIYKTQLPLVKCDNYIIATKNGNKIIEMTMQGLLKKIGKYVIFVTHGMNEVCSLFTQDIYFDVSVIQVDFNNLTLPVHLGIYKNASVDLGGRKLRVVTFHNPPFTVYKDGTVDGVEMRVVRVLSETFNFSMEIHVPHDGYLWGQKNESGSWTGLKGELSRNEADIGVALIYMNEIHQSIFQLTYPYTMVCLSFLVPAPKKLLGNWDALLKPLQLHVWLMLVFIAGIHTTMFYFVSRMSFNKCLLETIRSASLTSGPQPSGPISQRILFIGWILGCFFISGLYNSELSSWLVTQSSEQELKTIEDLAKSHIVWGRQDNDLAQTMATSSNEASRILATKFQLEKSDEDINRNAERGNYAVFVHVLSDGYPSGAEFLSRNIRNDLITLPECISKSFVSIGLANDLPIGIAVSHALKLLDSAGLLQEWQARDVRKHGDGANYMNKKVSDVTFSAFTIYNLAGAFALFGIGNLIAIFSFCFELVLDRHYKM